MSSLVQAKCTNSPAALSSALLTKRPLSQYSTAFTSWLVVRSMSLMACASASEKRATSPRSRPRHGPCALHLHAPMHEAELAQQRAKGRDLGGVAAVQGRQGGEGGKRH